MTEATPLAVAAADALAGWRYIRKHYGDLYGVGWERVETALVAALSPPTAQSSRSEARDAAAVLLRCNGHDLDVWTDGEWPDDDRWLRLLASGVAQ